MTYEQTKRGGKTHAMAECRECNWFDGNFLTAVKSSYKHTEKTGHKTIVETGYVMHRTPIK